MRRCSARLYIMSPCCLSVRAAPPAEIVKAIAEVKTPADSAKLSFFARATLATAAAWSPNPQKPPLYLDMPVVNGEPQPEVLGKWAANSPLAFADQYIGESAALFRHRHRRGRPGRIAHRHGQTTGDPPALRHCQHLRGIQRHAHQRSGGSLPEFRDAILQQAPGVRMNPDPLCAAAALSAATFIVKRFASRCDTNRVHRANTAPARPSLELRHWRWRSTVGLAVPPFSSPQISVSSVPTSISASTTPNDRPQRSL